MLLRREQAVEHHGAGAQLVWRNLRDLFSYAAYLLDDIAGGLVPR